MANLRSCALSAALFLLAALPAAQSSSKEPPREWTDPDTGHRVVRLSDEPGSQSLYFHQNAYTPDGSKLIITTPTGLATIDLKTRAIDKVVEGRVNLIMTARRTGRAYYVKGGAVHAVDLGTKVSTAIATLPPRARDRTDNALPNSKDLIQPGVLKAEKLVNLARHDYTLEPNVTFTPDMRWIVFRSNMFGPTHVFAVEVNKQ